MCSLAREESEESPEESDRQKLASVTVLEAIEIGTGPKMNYLVTLADDRA